ncbi:hypothetical protein [Thioalkalivibrio sp. ALMg11]|uniref:hypothetical protein n=1 Tax=Thioalkalivibrio sp. ALMg11 TaxID=1158165 RepID=UPI00037D7614|nr:hypothetical protein [Thioalkalivibrio sp. ALMg11]
MEVPVSNPSAAIPIGTRPTGSDRLGLGQLSTPADFERPLNDPEAGAARRPLEDRPEQDDNRRGDAEQDQGLAFPRSDQEMASRARVAAQIEAFRSGNDSAEAPPADGSPLGGAGVEALRRRVELAVSLAGPAEEPRRELNVVI